MDCHNARDWLLDAEAPGRLEDAPAGLAAHVEACVSCRRLAGRLDALEQSYRDELRPLTGETGRVAFLARLEAPRPARRVLLRRWALAAAVLLAIGVAAWVLWPAPRQDGTADVIERLLAWNLDLTGSPTPDQRSDVYAERAPLLKEALREADLAPEDRQLAVALLESGTWLAANVDPADEADRFNHLADQLLAQLDEATTKKDAKRIRWLAKFYRRVAERGIQANLKRAASSTAPNVKRKLERVIARDAERTEKLAELLQRAPNASLEEIRRALDAGRKPRKKPRK
jgi:hypothetical protein